MPEYHTLHRYQTKYSSDMFVTDKIIAPVLFWLLLAFFIVNIKIQNADLSSAQTNTYQVLALLPALLWLLLAIPVGKLLNPMGGTITKLEYRNNDTDRTVALTERGATGKQLPYQMFGREDVTYTVYFQAPGWFGLRRGKVCSQSYLLTQNHAVGERFELGKVPL